MTQQVITTEVKQYLKLSEEEWSALEIRGIVQSQKGLLISTAHYRNLYELIEELQKILKEWKRNNNASAEKYGIPTQTLTSHKTKLHWRNVGGKREKSLRDIQKELAEGNPLLMSFLTKAQAKYDGQVASGAGRTLVVSRNPDYKPRA